MLLVLPKAHAAFLVSDGDFELGGDETNAKAGFGNSPWQEERTVTEDGAEFIKGEEDSNSPDDGDALTSGDVFAAFGTVVNDTGETARLYQNIGTYAGETTLPVQFTAIDLTNQTFAPLTLELWVGGTAASADDGVTLGSGVGATLDDSLEITASDITVDSATVLQRTLTFGTNATPSNGDEVWLAFAKLTPASTVAAFDDVSVIPEPGTLALLGLSGLAMLAFARRRRS